MHLLSSLRNYEAAWLTKDVSSGLAIAAVGLPSAIAYPAIAGLPPQTGLYASIAPLAAYAIFGPSRRLIVGPDAATMTVLAALPASIAAASTTPVEPAVVASIVAIVVGCLCIVARLLRLGVLATFLSRPILTGFFAGISLSIIVGQIGRFTGISIEAEGLLSPIIEMAGKLPDVHWPSLILATGMLGLLFALKAVRFPIPAPVAVVALSVLLSALFDFEGRGIAVVGHIPDTLPSFRIPDISGLPLDQILIGAMAVFLVSFGAGVITAKSFGAMGGEPVDPNGELEGFAAANIAAGLFGAFPVSASDSRTAVNYSIGGRTQLASLVAAGALLVVIVFLSGALRLLPVPALGAILVSAALSLIDVSALRQLWRISPVEFVFAIIALWGPIALGVLNGVMVAIAATLIYLLSKMMYPRDALLGLIPGREGFYKLHRHPEARAEPGLGLALVQGSMLFFNADYVHKRLLALAQAMPTDTRWFVLDAAAITQIDSTSVAAFHDTIDDMAKMGLKFGIAELHAEVHVLLDRGGVLAHMGADMVFDDVEDALRAFRLRHPEYQGAGFQ